MRGPCVGTVAYQIYISGFLFPVPSSRTPISFRMSSTLMSSTPLSRAELTCLTALQIWDTELGPTAPGDVISCDIVVPTEISDLLADIILAVRSCLAAFRQQGKNLGQSNVPRPDHCFSTSRNRLNCKHCWKRRRYSGVVDTGSWQLCSAIRGRR